MITPESSEPSNHAASPASALNDEANKGDQEGSVSYLQSGKQVASSPKRPPRGKNDHRWWLPRIFKPISGRGETSPHYAMRIKFRGRRVAFTLSTGNRDAAARRAAALYGDIVHRGLDSVLAERRALKKSGNVETSTQPLTIGAWIDSASKVFDGKPVTFRGYAGALRLVASEILAVPKDNKRFAWTHATAYRRKIDGAPLSILTTEAVQAWRIHYVQRVGNNPAKQRTARITCNSTLRTCRALFSKKILKFVGAGMALPDPLPFTGVGFYKQESMRYHSKIDPEALLRAASQELAEGDSDAFVALLLALGAGLRRGEIDRLLWRQIDFRAGLIHVEVTEVGGLKSPDSTGSVPIDETLSSVLQGFRAKAQGQYVIEEGISSTVKSKPWHRRYRCQDVFDRLLTWLRKNGVESRSPLHTLRKEAGSIVATQSGIFAASRFLRHADMQVTAKHYAAHKERVTINMSALLPPSNVIELGKSVEKPLLHSTQKIQ